MVNDSQIKLLIAGDFCSRERLQDMLDNATFEPLFSSVRDASKSCDCFIVNYESVVAEAEDKPIRKLGANLKSTISSIEALKWFNINVVTVANNHFMDYGQSAAERTLHLFNQHNIRYVGAGNSIKDAQSFLILKIKEKRIAIINACEHEFSIAGENSFGCNPIDPIDIANQIKTAKEVSDYVICIFHGGNEHYQLPSPRMKKWYRFFVDNGADAVINHHQHCFSGYEIYKEKPIFYGLGNFCFDSASDNKYRHHTWNYGYLVSLSIEDDIISFKLIPYEQCWNKPGVFIFSDGSEIKSFNQEIEQLNVIIADDRLLTEEYKRMAVKRRDLVYGGFRPYSSRLLKSLNSRGLFPSFLSSDRLTTIKAFLDCESHHDVLMYNLSADDNSSKPKI